MVAAPRAQIVIQDDDTRPEAPATRPPTEITLSNARVEENRLPGALVGVLSATDPDPGDSFVFAFTPDGYPGNLFRLVGSELRTNPVLDHEQATNRTVGIKVTDSGGNTLDRSFRIAIVDMPEPTAGAASGTVRGSAGDDLVGAFKVRTANLWGGEGDDVFLIGEGARNGVRDTVFIRDYEAGDRLLLAEGVSIANARELSDRAVLTRSGDGDLVTVFGVTSFNQLAFAEQSLP